MHAPPKILGLGSSHGDDQAAWRLIERLSSDPKCADRCAQLRSPWDVLSHLADGGPVIIVDACISGAAAGTIRRWSAQELPSDCGIRTSSHGGSLAETFALARTLGYDLSKTSVIGIEAGANGPGTPLCQAVEQAVDELVRQLSNEITRSIASTDSMAP